MTAPNIVLKMGSQGPAVTKLQQYLNQLGAQVAVDGAFGMDTRTAVLAVQQRLKVSSDGVVGPATWAAISEALRMSLNVTAADAAATSTPSGVVPSPAPGSETSGSSSLPVPANGGPFGWFRGLTTPMKLGFGLLVVGGIWALLPDKPKSSRLGARRRG